MSPPQPPPNPFARPSPWGNLPPTRIRLDPAARPQTSAAPQARRPDSRTVMLSGFSAPPPPRPRPAVAPTPEPQAAMPDLEPVMADEPSVPFAAPMPPMRARPGVPAPALMAGGLALAVAAGLGIAAISPNRPPPAPPPGPAARVAVAPAPPPTPIRAAAPAVSPPELVVDPAIAVKRAAAEATVRARPLRVAAAARTPAHDAPEPPPLLAIPRAGPVVAPGLAEPAVVVRPPVDPEAPIPTRTRAPD